MTTWTDLGPGIFVRRYESLDLNVGAVVCGDGVLLIDTRANHVEARELRDHLREVTRLPVRWVFNTHFHWDHTFGNAEFLPATIWGHERCASALVDYGHRQLEMVIASAPEREATFREVTITPPTRTFTTSATVTFGERTVELRYHGRGHTDGDATLHIADAEVTFAGDLIEEGAPPSFTDSFPLDWPVTLAALQPDLDGPVVPGHGAVVDAAYVGDQQAQLATVADQARQHHANGIDPAKAAKRGGPFPEPYLRVAYARAYQQLDVL